MADPFTIALAAAPVAASIFGKKKKTSQVPLETPEQAEARRRLNEFGRTGTFNGFNAGEEVPLGYGDYSTTGIENSGISALQNLLSSGIPAQYSMGDEALRDILSTSQDQIDSQFSPFKALVDRSTRESTDAYKRASAFGGNLYSTATMRGLGDIQSRSNETLTAKLAELTNEALNRKLNAIPLAYRSAESQENLNQGRLASAFQYGGLTRQLNDAAIKARDAEILRRRQELQLPIQATQTVAGSSVPFGIPEVTTSPYQDLLGLAGQLGGQYIGNQLFMNQYKQNFPTNVPRYGQSTVFSR